MKLFVTLATFVGLASAACPNSCSGHGTCDQYDACTCFKETPMALADFHGTIQVEWTGADCSRRTCPRGISWSKSSGDTDQPAGPTTNVQTVKWQAFATADQLLELPGPIDLTFSWDEKSGFDVYQFSTKKDFDDCKFVGGTGTATELGRPSDSKVPYNSATVQITTAGPHYFADKDECKNGHKLAVKQVDALTADIDWKANAAPVTVEGGPAVVTFKWSSGTHTVYQMKDKASYDACTFTGGKQLG